MLVDGAQGSTAVKHLAWWFRERTQAPHCLDLCSDRLGMPATGKEKDRRSHEVFPDPLETGRPELEPTCHCLAG